MSKLALSLRGKLLKANKRYCGEIPSEIYTGEISFSND